MNDGPRLLKAWLAFAVISAVGGFVAGGLAGFFVGFVLGASGVEMEVIKPVCAGAGFLAGLPVSYLAYAWTVRHLVLPQLQPGSAASPPAA